MIILLRYVKNGEGYKLNPFDIEKFSEQQVIDRLSELGIDEDEVYVSDILDWDLNRFMSLSEVYRLKSYFLDLYDGDNYLLKFLLKKGVSFKQIFSHYYVYFGKDEVQLMIKMLGEGDQAALIRTFNKAYSWDNFVMDYVNEGFIVGTPKGFYISSLFLVK